MIVMLWVSAAVALLELGLYGPVLLWRGRMVLAIATMTAGMFSAAALAVAFPSVFSGLLLGLAAMRAFNMIRIIHGRMHERYMRTAARRTSLVLIGLQLVVAGLWALWHRNQVSGDTLWLVLTGAQLAGAVILLSSTMRRLRHTAWPEEARHITDAELPTLTIAVPARNETDDLHACLESIIASDYPKLEIIVLDDCSQTRRTPDIIRGFAHDGVRFVKGEEPLETWLPKNQAYNRLVAEASGDYLLFCGVDIRFERDAVRNMITMMLSKRKTMLSVLPDRALEARAAFSPAQALRYFWELAPPRRLFGKPAVLSSCWIIRKDALLRAGGFEAVRRSIVPEAYFAKRLVIDDEYSFMRAGSVLGVTSIKGNAEQQATAVRVRYPQLHRRPEQVFIIFCAELIFLVSPIVLAIFGYWLGIGGYATLFALAASVMLMITDALIVRATHIGGAAVGFIGLPLVTIYDLGILYYSMWQYEFSTVDWKGRNICVPAMHVIPHLPKVE
jgi:glycosyltransferase involved in cell wall biosynthesis